MLTEGVGVGVRVGVRYGVSLQPREREKLVPSFLTPQHLPPSFLPSASPTPKLFVLPCSSSKDHSLEMSGEI